MSVCVSVSIDVTVQVLGPSQDSPDFIQSQYEVDIDEGEALFTNITTVTADDPDPSMLGAVTTPLPSSLLF